MRHTFTFRHVSYLVTPEDHDAEAAFLKARIAQAVDGYLAACRVATAPVHHRINQVRKTYQITCGNCGHTFTTTYARKRYCTPSCSRAASRFRQLIRQAARSTPTPTPGPAPDMADITHCAVCHKPLSLPRDHVDTCGARCWRTLLQTQRAHLFPECYPRRDR